MSFPRMHDDQVDSDADLVRRLLHAQQPQWADLPITRVRTDGTDNAIYRLGDELVARLPLIHWAVDQAAMELEWLPRLQPLVPVEVPKPLVLCDSSADYPYPWAVYRWLDGDNPDPGDLADPVQLALDLAAYVKAMHAVELADVPRSGRGGPLRWQDADIRGAIEQLRDEVDADALLAIWQEALDAPAWNGGWVPIHGDLSDGNLLVRDGRLAAVIDFSCFGLGDPATDVDVAWDLFDGESREAYLDALAFDDATIARAKGWAVRSVYGIPYYRETNPGIVLRNRRKVANVIADHHRG